MASLLYLPTFVFGVGVMFWAFQVAALTGFLKWWRFGRGRNDVEGVSKSCKAAFAYKVLKVGNEELCKKKCVYLINHRSWADFFCDIYVVAGRACPLSRKEVGMAFPAFTSSLMALKAVLLFNRSGVRDTEKFNRWIDKQTEHTHSPSLIVYPEGHRSQKKASLPLKRGMLRYAFSRRLPIQVVMTAGKEEVINEKKCWMHFGRTLVTGFSETLESSKFEDFEDFMREVQMLWDAQWERVHAAPREGLPEYEPSFPEKSYSTTVLVLESAALAGWGGVMLYLGYRTAKALAALSAGSTAGAVAVAGLGLWTAASFVAAFGPIPAGTARPTKQE